ncbi:MAG: polysaccharide pyruvyl transferase family protein [Ignavibacteria bacterium]
MRVFFGAFDRHNLGDILLAHVAAAGVEQPVFAGLAARDLRACGGQRVVPVDSLSAPMALVHVGGELLDCDAAQAAHMLGETSPPWGRLAPYVVARERLPAGSKTVFEAVGGVGLSRREPAFREEVAAALRSADEVGVRDGVTRDWLASVGIEAALRPDPVTRVADFFGDRIRERIRRSGDYIALQFAAECGDDRTLTAFARGLKRIGLPVVLFRAGAAPWHDALEPYDRLASRLRAPAEVFASLDVWDICGLIAGSRGFVGTSLHGRIVAEAFGVPALSLEREARAGEKLRAYLATWRPDAEVLAPEDFADAADRLIAA